MEPDFEEQILSRHAAMQQAEKENPGSTKSKATPKSTSEMRIHKPADEVVHLDDEPSIIDYLLGRRWKSSGMLLQSTTGSALVAIRQRGEPLTCREALFLVLNEPASGQKAFWWGRVMQIFLICSALATTYETVGFINEATGPDIWRMIKMGFNFFFTIEALLRIVCFIPLRQCHRSAYVWLDLISIFPFYVRMFLYPDSLSADNYLSKSGAGITIRVFEALASLRLLKLCRYYEGASLLATAVGKSLKQLYVPLFMLLIMVFCL